MEVFYTEIAKAGNLDHGCGQKEEVSIGFPLNVCVEKNQVLVCDYPGRAMPIFTQGGARACGHRGRSVVPFRPTYCLPATGWKHRIVDPRERVGDEPEVL